MTRSISSGFQNDVRFQIFQNKYNPRKIGIFRSNETDQNVNEHYLSILAWSQEISDTPLEEDFESIDEDEQDIPESTPISDIRLEAIIIHIFLEVKSLGKHSPSWALVQESAIGNFMTALRQ